VPEKITQDSWDSPEEPSRRRGEIFADALTRLESRERISAGEVAFASVFDNAPIAMLILDRERRIRGMNRQAAKLFSTPEKPPDGSCFGTGVRCLHSLDDPEGCGLGDFCRTSCIIRRTVAETYETGRSRHQVETDFIIGEGANRRDLSFLISTAVIGRRDSPKLLICIKDITERKRAQEQLKRALEEVSALKDRLERENIILRSEIELRHLHADIIGESDAIRGALSRAEQVAATGSTVLITGETGTGKELLARTIHRLSPRSGLPMVTVNCAALPETLLESELFGREKGAFTGALTKQKGRFEIADGSTIFLDEISELSPGLQAKLLRVIEQGTFERLGSPATVTTDARVIAATNRSLEEMVREGGFREDLYYRIKVFPIHLPPLRERTADIPLLVWSFVQEFAEKMGKKIESITRSDMESLRRYPWPGNIRELRNVIEHAMIVSEGPVLRIEIPQSAGSEAGSGETLREIERDHIVKVLERTGWRIKGRGGAAEILGMKPTTLHSRMLKLGINRPPK